MDVMFIRLDGIKWQVSRGSVVALCPKHNLELIPGNYGRFGSWDYEEYSSLLKCEDCDEPYNIPRPYSHECEYVVKKIDSTLLSSKIKKKEIKFIDLDDQQMPISEAKAKNDRYWVKAELFESPKVGLRLLVYIGEVGERGGKVQFFLEPDIKRLVADQNDKDPLELLTVFSAVFKDGTEIKTKKVS